MKNKKKLLVAVAAMGLLAVGTAGVGTAAWYQAAQKATLSSATKYTVTTSAGTLDDIALKVVFTISQENGVELTAAASETTKYHSNGEDMPKTSPKTVGEFYVTNVTWDTSDPNYSDSKKNSLAAATYEVTLGSEGNVNILASSSWAASNGTLKFKFSVADGGALSLKTDGGMTGMTYAASKITGHYRVKANNESYFSIVLP